MTEFDIHILIMCIFVFVLLVTISSVLLVVIYKQAVHLIRLGAYDEKITAEQSKNDNKKHRKAITIIGIIVQVLLWGILISALVVNFTIGINKNNMVGDGGSFKTVESSSMSYANPRNEYLEENELTTQVDMSDLIRLEKLPSEEEIKVYDVIMYENSANHALILHRIVGMYDDYDLDGNKVRYYVFRGDAVPNDDGNIVTYEDMRGIYRGNHIHGIGSFIRFMHTPAGYLCLSFVMIVLVAMPIFDSRMSKAKRDRLDEIEKIDEIEE